MMRRTLVVALAAVLAVGAACGDDGDSSDDSTSEPAASGCEVGAAVTTDSGLKIEELECGDGAEAASDDSVRVNYTGTLEDGTVFDSTEGRGPADFSLLQVIPGFSEGITGMRVGGRRKLTIPPDLGYGETGQGSIPPNATLIFEVELVDILSSP